MCDSKPKSDRTAADLAVEAAYELADMASRHFDKPISRDKLYSFIMGDWSRIAPLAHKIHNGERRTTAVEAQRAAEAKEAADRLEAIAKAWAEYQCGEPGVRYAAAAQLTRLIDGTA